MAMVINDNGSGGGVQKTPEQIAAELARRQRELARQKEIARLKKQIQELEDEIKLLKQQQEEFSNMIGSLGVALGYLEQAKGEAEGIRGVLSGSYNGYNAKTYVNQIDKCQGDITLNISTINRVSEAANEMLAEITEKIQNKTIRKSSLKSALAKL